MTGVQTPLQSGSLASACQSCSGRRCVDGIRVGHGGHDGEPANARPRHAHAMRRKSQSAGSDCTPGLQGIIQRLDVLRTHLKRISEALVNPRMAFEVLWDGRGADVLDARSASACASSLKRV